MQPAPRPRTQSDQPQPRRWENSDDVSEDVADDIIYAPAWFAVARGAALFFGLFALVGLFAEMQQPAARVNLWWADFHGIPPASARAFIGLLATLLVMFAVSPKMALPRRLLTILCILAFCIAAARNARDFYAQLHDGQIRVQAAIPFDLHLAALMTVVLAGVLRTGWEATRPTRDLIVGSLAFSLCVAALPLAQMLCFFEPAQVPHSDAVIVLGYLTGFERHEDDRLAERVRAGCECYQQKRAAKVILCGSPGDTAVHETMQRIATEMGVPADALILDTTAANTQAAIDASAKLLESSGSTSAIVVSQTFRLARLDLAYRKCGKPVHLLSAPAQKHKHPDAAAYAAEAAALWAQYLSPLTGRPAPL